MRPPWPLLALLGASACHKLDPQLPAQAVAKGAKGPPQASAPASPRAATRTGAPSAEARGEARALYQQRCILCHGRDGRGDGIAAVNLRPSPRSLRDDAWQRGTRDEDIAAILVKGGGAVGKSLMMPPNRDLGDKPEVLAALVELVRSFASR